MKISNQIIFKAMLLGIGFSIIVNGAIFSVGKVLGGFPPNFTVEMVKGPITIFNVLMASIVPGIFGAALFWLLNNFIASAKNIFRVIATVFMLFSLAGPFQINGAPGAMLASLILMHIATASIITYYLAYWTGKQ